MKKYLIFILTVSSLVSFAQEEMETDFEAETTLSSEEVYESEMFAQKQDEVSYTSSPLIDSSDDDLAEEEVYDSESDY